MKDRFLNHMRFLNKIGNQQSLKSMKLAAILA